MRCVHRCPPLPAAAAAAGRVPALISFFRWLHPPHPPSPPPTVQWRIEKFSTTGEMKLYSPVFEVGGHSWCVGGVQCAAEFVCFLSRSPAISSNELLAPARCRLCPLRPRLSPRCQHRRRQWPAPPVTRSIARRRRRRRRRKPTSSSLPPAPLHLPSAPSKKAPADLSARQQHGPPEPVRGLPECPRHANASGPQSLPQADGSQPAGPGPLHHQGRASSAAAVVACCRRGEKEGGGERRESLAASLLPTRPLKPRTLNFEPSNPS